MLVDSILTEDWINVTIESLRVDVHILKREENVLIQTIKSSANVRIAIQSNLLSEVQVGNVVEVLVQNCCTDEEVSVIRLITHTEFIQVTDALSVLDVLIITVSQNNTIFIDSSPHILAVQINLVFVNLHVRLSNQTAQLNERFIQLRHVLLVERAYSVTVLQIVTLVGNREYRLVLTNEENRAVQTLNTDVLTNHTNLVSD